MANGLNKIFVRRFRIGFKGTKEYDELVKAKNSLNAKKAYCFARGLKKCPSNVIVKRG